MSYYLGIDHSLTTTAVCLKPADDDSRRSGDYRIIKPKRKGVNRLKYIEKNTREFLIGRDIQYGGVEHGAFGGKGRVYQLGGVCGIIELVMYDLGVSYVAPAPNSLKKYFTGDGAADKSKMIDEALKKAESASVKDAIQSDKGGNVADAYALAHMAETVDQNKEITGDRKDALETVLNNKKRLKNPTPLFHK